MPRHNLASLAIAAIDQLEQLTTLQLLVRITLEQFETEKGETGDRADLLLRAYLSRAENHIDELRINLERIRLIVGGIAIDDQDG